MMERLNGITKVEVVKDEEFLQIPATEDFKRFFKYWDLVEETALKKSGRSDA